MRSLWLQFFLLVMLFSIVCLVIFGAAQPDDYTTGEPALLLYTNKPAYSAGESGFLILILETYGKMDSAEMEIGVLSPRGVMVEGYLIYTDIPKTVVVDRFSQQTEQVVYNESVPFFGRERTIYRVIDFEVPLDVLTGEYRISGLVTGSGFTLREEVPVHFSGPGGFLDVIFLVYIAVLLFSLYLLRRS